MANNLYVADADPTEETIALTSNKTKACLFYGEESTTALKSIRSITGMDFILLKS
jgi:hypothetical protein